MAQWPSLEGHPFNVSILEMMKVNWFFHSVGALLVTSAVAAFMSTSDSTVLAASNAFTMDYWSNWLAKYAKKEGDQTVSLVGTTLIYTSRSQFIMSIEYSCKIRSK